MGVRRREKDDYFAWLLHPVKIDWRDYYFAVIEGVFKRLMFDLEDV